MSPDTWGNSAWNLFHKITLAYPDDPSEVDKNNYYNFFMDLKNVLPCSTCRNNYTKHLDTNHPLTMEDLKDKDSLVKWLIDLHNIVNESTGKKKISYEKALRDINDNRSKKTLYIYVFLLIIIILLLIILFMKKN
jgi:hypothetical protein